MKSKHVPCERCQDTGWIVYIAGTYPSPSRGRVTATPEKPVVRRCRHEESEQE